MKHHLIMLIALSFGASSEAQDPAEKNIEAAVELSAGKKLEGAMKDKFRFVAKDLRCPTCQGMSVLESDAKFSLQIKDMVESKIREGWDKSKILKFFTDRYGPWILREPPKEGFSLVAWVLPIILLLAGPVFLYLGTFRKRIEVPTEGVRGRGMLLEEMLNRLESMKSDRKGQS